MGVPPGGKRMRLKGTLEDIVNRLVITVHLIFLVWIVLPLFGEVNQLIRIFVFVLSIPLMPKNPSYWFLALVLIFLIVIRSLFSSVMQLHLKCLLSVDSDRLGIGLPAGETRGLQPPATENYVIFRAIRPWFGQRHVRENITEIIRLMWFPKLAKSFYFLRSSAWLDAPARDSVGG